MIQPLHSNCGNGRRGFAAQLGWSLGAMVAFASISVVAQDQPSIAPATSPRLPGDQPRLAPSPGTSTAGAPSAEQMQQMMELSKTNENHKLLASLDGTWDYKLKFWMDGNTSAKPEEEKGVAVRKSLMDGRYVTLDVTGMMHMPGADGKMQAMNFVGHGLEGYDNVKKKFVATWIDNMGTGIMMSEGDYDPASKTFTYTGEIEPMPGMKQKVREVVKAPDKDHMLLEWYEVRGTSEAKTMEIAYTKRK